MSEKHGITSGTVPNLSNQITFIHPALDSNKLLMTRASEKRYDTSLANYIVRTRLPHMHVMSNGFLDFMCDFVPGYVIKSPNTIKRTILRMCVLVRQMIINYLCTQDCRFAFTFDGWSISSM